MTQHGESYRTAQQLNADSENNSSLTIIRNFDINHRRSDRLQIIEWLDESAYIYGTGSVSTKDIKNTFHPSLFLSMTEAINEICRLNLYADITIVDIIQILSQYCRFTDYKILSPESLFIFYDHCKRNHLTHFNKMRSFIIYWSKFSPNAIDKHSILAIQSFSSIKPSRPSGSNVRSDDESEGWLTDEEYHAINDTIWSDFESGINSLWNTTASLLCAQYGRRPIQLAHLKIKDLKQITKIERNIEFPGAKDQESEGFRLSKFEIHPIGDHLWELCQRLAAESIYEFEKLLGPLPYDSRQELPLFYPRSGLADRLDIVNKIDGNSLERCASRFFHTRAKRMSTVLRRSTGTPVWSIRTNDFIVENAYRFRYTRARQLARLGVPRATLSFWLGHERHESLDAYYDDPAERSRVLNDGISNIMAPLAQAFRGRFIRNQNEATRASDASSLIELDGNDNFAVGNCGSEGFCTASVPIPCYRCTKFEPWLDGPHEEVLARLLERQDEENKTPLPGSGRRILTPLQLDRDIQAVLTVINQCDKIRLLNKP
jgi:integrase